MKFQPKSILIALLIGLFLYSCSTKKDGFVNRNWHALNTKYNVLYNGNIAFEQGRQQLNDTYQDNYWEILPVERLNVTDEIKLDSEDNNPNFVRAEEKATKAIQKHSMDINDLERNPQTDEAFLLLGKARYFDERYIPALESFNYILKKYDRSDKLNEAAIWREKTNLRLGYEELTIKNIKRLLRYESLKDQEYADARALLGQAYINLKHNDTAIQNLKAAASYTRKPAEKGRYYYIIGQLFQQMDQLDSARIAFDEVIALNRRSPRIYMINAEIQKIKQVPLNNDSQESVLEYLTDMEENRENRPYLDIIYRQLALFHRDTGSDSLSLANYNKSIRATNNVPELSALNYEDLANHYFDEQQYKNSGAYYDSVLLNRKEGTKKYRQIQKKRENLEDVIKYEGISQTTDSIIRLYEMSPIQREIYFTTYVDSLKALAAAAEKEKEDRLNTGLVNFAQSKGGRKNQGKFYFYNITSLGYGKTAFKNQWGNRPLEDNWRWSTKGSISGPDAQLLTQENSEVSSGPVVDSLLYSVDFYLSSIPQDPVKVDSMRSERNFADYQLGVIYKEKFREYLKASEKFQSVLNRNPEERLILPSKYNLYKIYETTQSPLAEGMKQDIITNHRDSRYASILINPEVQLSGLENSPEGVYDRLYKKYTGQEFLQVITGTEDAIKRFTGDPIVPKLEMLKANALGRLQGFEAYREAVNFVALNYPNTAVGKKAQQIVDQQMGNLAGQSFSSETGSRGSSNWKLVFPMKRSQQEQAQKLLSRLEDCVKDLKYSNIISRDVYNLEDQFIVVHGFKSKDFALGFAELIKYNKDYRIDNENFVILSGNYKIVQIHKNLEDYKRQILTPKP